MQQNNEKAPRALEKEILRLRAARDKAQTLRKFDIEIQSLRDRASDLADEIRGSIVMICACVNVTDAQKAKLPELLAIQTRIHGLLRHIKKAGKLPPPRKRKGIR